MVVMYFNLMVNTRSPNRPPGSYKDALQAPRPCKITATVQSMTGYGQAQDREATRAAGFDQHMVKPVNLDALRQWVDHLSA